LALVAAAQDITSEARTRWQTRRWALERLSPQAQVNNYRQQVDHLVQRVGLTLRHRFSLQREQIKNLAAQLDALNPLATLNRGYALVEKDQTVVTRTDQVNPGDDIVIQVRDGTFEATVSKSEAPAS
jgi:exodeoxyribonuclease VII large subunit